MLIPLKLLHDQPLQQQLYDQLRDLIASGRLAAGIRMPSSRMLADQFSISRITVVLTYERLIAEGYLQTVPAVGTFVANAAPRAEAEDEGGAPPVFPLAAPEAVGRPDPLLFPAGRWRALMRSTLDRLGSLLASQHPAGSPVLRAAIARWLSSSRGLAVVPEQVILTGGRQQALHIAAHLLLRPGDCVVLEDPCNEAIAGLYATAQAQVLRVGVDLDGLCVDHLPGGSVALVHVTPDHQRPLGVAMSPDRRASLLAWAEFTGAMVLEEDTLGDFRYAAPEAPSLMSGNPDGRVLHIGCFGQSLGPGVTLGYLVVPRRLIAPALAERRLVDDHALWLEEIALAELLDSGGYARHVHRLRKVYMARRDTLTAALHRHFGPTVRLSGIQGSLHLAWWLPDRFAPAVAVATLAKRFGLEAAALPDLGALLLGFGMPGEEAMALGVERLAAQLLPSPRTRSVG